MSAQRLGPYRLARRIAAGGMAEIFLAVPEHAASGDGPVVVKRLFRDLARHEDVIRAFQREAQVMAAIHHPGVPRILDAGCHGPDWFIAMEHVEGIELAAVLREGSMPCPWDAVMSIGHQLALILQHVHACSDGAGRPLGLVHADVNPSNVVVRPDGTLTLLDFGVACIAADAQAGAPPRGTLRYMAPEQIMGGRIDARTDLHAWGAIVFELSTDRPLRSGPDPQVMLAIVEQEPPRPAEVRADFPADLEQLILSCLARRPDHRPASTEHLRRAVEGIARDHGWTLAPEVVATWCERPRSRTR